MQAVTGYLHDLFTEPVRAAVPTADVLAGPDPRSPR